jgi:hypothetical protein
MGYFKLQLLILRDIDITSCEIKRVTVELKKFEQNLPIINDLIFVIF